CTSLQMVPPDASVLARGLKLLTTSYLDVYSYQRHLQAEVESMLATRYFMKPTGCKRGTGSAYPVDHLYINPNLAEGATRLNGGFYILWYRVWYPLDAGELDSGGSTSGAKSGPPERGQFTGEDEGGVEDFGGSLLMPPRATSVTTTEGAGGGQTIVPMGELVRTLGYTLIWGPGECYLEDGDGTRTPLNVSTGCPQLCEAAALALISKLEDKKRERLENETMTTLDVVNLAALNMERSWWDYVREYAESGSKEAALRGLRDAPFLQGLPGECLGGLVPEDVKDAGWSLMKKVDFLTRAQKRRMWTAKRWIVHLYAGNPGHYQMFQLDEGDTMVIELDVDRNKAHDDLLDELDYQ
ncbi:unnamed protein product, partial [Symbiodinium sp. KB8]